MPLDPTKRLAVFETTVIYTKEQMDDITDRLKSYFGDEVNVLVLSSGLHLVSLEASPGSGIRPEEFAQLRQV